MRINNTLRLHVADPRTTEIIRWIEWVVEERLPLTFCERRFVRQNARMGSISAKTLASYISSLYDRVQGEIRALLPDKFALVIDGWASGGRHYVAIFAVFNGETACQTDREASEDYYDDLDCLSRRFFIFNILASRRRRGFECTKHL